ncbi:hypothetical protein ACJJTC_001521, partial [Scirpophaga incertulas]
MLIFVLCNIKIFEMNRGNTCLELLESLNYFISPENVNTDVGNPTEKLSKDRYQLKELRAESLRNILKGDSKIEAYGITSVSTSSNPTQTSLVKIFRRREPIRKNIHTTQSNHECSIENNKISQLVSGRKKKICILKATESANFLKQDVSKHEHVSLVQISNLKLVLGLLNMDNRKEKVVKKKKKSKNDERNKPIKKNKFDKNEQLRQCMCVIEPKHIDLNVHRSNVKITGQLGLTEDDRYVLKCAATVNNNPVEVQQHEDYDYPLLFMNKERRRNKDFSVQVDITKDYRYNRDHNTCGALKPNLFPKKSSPSRLKKTNEINSKNKYLNINTVKEKNIKSYKKDDTATNTDQNITKKMLIDSYTKHYMASINKNFREGTAVPCNSSVHIDADIKFRNNKDDNVHRMRGNDAANS